MEPKSYRIIVRGRLTDRFATSFDAMVDRPRDFGLDLLRVEEGAQ
jgi:hypothetical protein